MSCFNLLIVVVFTVIVANCYALTSPVKQVLVHDEFSIDVHQAWFPTSMMVDKYGHLWFNNMHTMDQVLRLNMADQHVDSFFTTPVSRIPSFGIGPTRDTLYLADNDQRQIVVIDTRNKQIIQSIPYAFPDEFSVFGLIVDSRGTMYITLNTSITEVWRMSSDGTSLPPLMADPPFEPQYMTLDANDMLYVTGNIPTQDHSQDDGIITHIFQFSHTGEQVGVMRLPMGISSLAVDSNFNLFVSGLIFFEDGSTSQQTLKIAADGTLIRKLDQYVDAMATDCEGNVYFAIGPGYIVKHDSELHPVAYFNSSLPLAEIAWVSTDSKTGDLLVVAQDSSLADSHALYRLSTDKSYMSAPLMQLPLVDNTFFFGASDVDCRFYAYSPSHVHDIIDHVVDGIFLKSVWLNNSDVIDGMSVGPDGHIYAIVSGNIIVYSADGAEIRVLPPGSDQSKMFIAPVAIYVDRRSHLFVLDVHNMFYELGPQDHVLWIFDASQYACDVQSFAVAANGDIFFADNNDNHFIHIQHSLNDTVVDYQFVDFLLGSPQIIVGNDSTVYVFDSLDRIITLRPKMTEAPSHWKTIVIVSAAVSSLICLVVIGVVAHRCVIAEQSVAVSVDEEQPANKTKLIDDSSSINGESAPERHASRRGRTSRRSERVNYLSHYHDNLRLPIGEEDSADYVLYI